MFALNPVRVNPENFVANYKTAQYEEIIGSTVDNAFEPAQSMKIYLNKTDHRVISRVLYFNKKFFSGLDPKFQKILMEEAKKAAQFEIELSIKDKEEKLKTLAQNKIELNAWTDAMKRKGRESFKPLYKKLSFEDQMAVKLIDQLK